MEENLENLLAKAYNAIVPMLTNQIFTVPIKQVEGKYFPDFLTECVDAYESYFENTIRPVLDSSLNNRDPGDKMLFDIKKLSKGIKETVVLYYEGKILLANEKFNNTLDEIDHTQLQLPADIEINSVFYRARVDKGQGYLKKDLFHVPFQSRNTVSTSRYSIPGLPALYLGSSTYVCWEEFDRHKFRDLYFSKFCNSKKVSVIQMWRAEDLISFTTVLEPHVAFGYTLVHLLLFPLTISCNFCVREPKAVFKPEYIIPQFLLQYVTNDKELDGIKYPSTKLDYTQLEQIEAYNYVFPVKQILKKGFCPQLIRTWKVTEPTSLELEELMYTPVSDVTEIVDSLGFDDQDNRKIKLIKGVDRPYNNTSFGLIEARLDDRLAEIIVQ